MSHAVSGHMLASIFISVSLLLVCILTSQPVEIRTVCTGRDAYAMKGLQHDCVGLKRSAHRALQCLTTSQPCTTRSPMVCYDAES